MTLFTEAFLTVVLLYISYYVISVLYRLSKKNAEFAQKFPGPPPFLCFGNLLDFKSTEVILEVMTDYSRKYGGLVGAHMGPVRKALLVTDYKSLESILSSNTVLKKSREYRFLEPWLGTGLLTSDGSKWKKHRRVLTPAFHFQILEQFIEVFESGGGKMVQKLETQVGKDSVDIYPFVTLCTLDIICETAMGISIHAQDCEDSEYVRNVKSMLRIITERDFSLLGQFDLTYPLTKLYWDQKKALAVLHEKTNSVIDQRRKELQMKKAEADSDSKRKKAFLDLLLEATVDDRPLTHEEIREEVDTFMFEGHDTTASAISFALYSLANNPEVQRKVLEEQVALFGGEKQPTPSYADLQAMKYLEQVIKETLRLYPSVPIYARETTEPIDLNGTIVPAGIQLTVFAYGIQRDAKHFPDPEKFNPSRFDDVDGRQPYAFIPFSAGPRNCIGQKFAMLEMKSTISKVVRKFELVPSKPPHSLKLAAEAVLKSTNGIKIGLKLRHS